MVNLCSFRLTLKHDMATIGAIYSILRTPLEEQYDNESRI